MRRALIVLAVAVVVAGSAVAYLGTRDHKAARFEEHLPTVPTLAGDGDGFAVVGRPTNPISPFQSDGFSIRAGKTTAVDLVAIAT